LLGSNQGVRERNREGQGIPQVTRRKEISPTIHRHAEQRALSRERFPQNHRNTRKRLEKSVSNNRARKEHMVSQNIAIVHYGTEKNRRSPK